MNDPDPQGQCLLVMATSIKKGRNCDPGCKLAAGCHSFISRPTYILYRLAACSPAAHIGNMVDKKYYTQKSDVSQDVYDLIRKGLYASDETRQVILGYARSVGI